MTTNKLLRFCVIIFFTMFSHDVSAGNSSIKEFPPNDVGELVDDIYRLDSIVHHQQENLKQIHSEIKITCYEEFKDFCTNAIAIAALFSCIVVGIVSWIVTSNKNETVSLERRIKDLEESRSKDQANKIEDLTTQNKKLNDELRNARFGLMK